MVKNRTCFGRSVFITMIFLTAILSAAASPLFSEKVTALSDDQRGAIEQNCATTKQSLKQLQKTDARTRSYLDSAYEGLLVKYITPLDLRLINAGQPNANLTTIHSNIITTRQRFVAEYTTYSQSLEELLSIDCYNHPDEFYNKLVETRQKRAELSSTTTNIRNLFSEHLTAVRRLKSSLGGDKNE
ncbi:hypothetical protein IKD60_02335 [Candidatus Saccharibacteria bacterium]|nr:hypothetical protein [Candidatus Saccharibacteria bacterium]